MKKGKHIIGKVHLKTDLSIMELGELISKNILGGAKLGGLERYIYEEVPAIYVQNGLFGLSVILQGDSGINNKHGFCFEIRPAHSEGYKERETVNISGYLISLFKARLANKNIIIIDETVS